ncbi:MAG: endospore germination permease [Bacillaceae bacterium]|nr:endospore germination permease [Bacillaceae bacterium]
MKTRISNLQLTLLTANFITASTLLVMPQAYLDLSLQNTWFVPFLWFLLTTLLITTAFVGWNKIETLDFQSDETRSSRTGQKLLAILMILFLMFILIRDLRAFTDFTGTALLELTPQPVIIFTSLICLLYLVWLGFEVIARFNDIYFSLLFIIILFLPLLLLNEIDMAKLLPPLQINAVPSILQTTFVGLAWVGELVIIFLFVGNVQPKSDVRRSVIWGVGLAVIFIFILLGSIISVLGSTLARYTVYPSYILVRQINITDFLDRLDLLVVSFWIPAIFSKMALTFYGIHRSFNMLFGTDTKIFLVPLALIIGFLSMMMFGNNISHFYFSIYVWSTLGLLLEILIVAVFMWIVRKERLAQSRDG